MVASYKLAPDDPLIQQMIDRFDDPATSLPDRRNLGFALSKVMEDTKQYDRVFKYLHAANALMRKEFPYDIASREKEVADIMAFFDNIDLARSDDRRRYRFRTDLRDRDAALWDDFGRADHL